MSAKRDEATRELDAKIAERVMGWTLTAPVEEGCDHSVGTYRDGSSAKRNFARDANGKEHALPRFSSDIASAWLVVEKMREISATFFELRSGGTLRQCGGNVTSDALTYYARFVGSLEPRGFVEADSAPLAICSAALSALSERAS